MTLSLSMYIYIHIISYISLQNYLSVQYVTRMWISPAVLATESSFKWPQQWYCSGQQCQCQQRWLSWSGKFKGLSYRKESYSKHWFILVLMWILQRLRVKYTDHQMSRQDQSVSRNTDPRLKVGFWNKRQATQSPKAQSSLSSVATLYWWKTKLQGQTKPTADNCETV